MGTGYNFKCKKCHYEYMLFLGIGMRFPSKYRECLNDIKEGKYGEEWKQLALSQEYIAVDASKYLYFCNFCGNWEISYSLSLYKPKDPNSVLNQQFGIKTVREWGYVPYVTPHELEHDYTFIKSYVHKCSKCGKRMHKTDTEQLTSSACPKCGTQNRLFNEKIYWD